MSRENEANSSLQEENSVYLTPLSKSHSNLPEMRINNILGVQNSNSNLFNFNRHNVNVTQSPLLFSNTPSLANSQRLHRNMNSVINRQVQTSNEQLPKFYIWGTQIVMEDLRNTILQFLLTFDIQDDLSFYCRQVYNISITEKPFVDIDACHIKSYDEQLYTQLINYPHEVIPAFDMIVNSQFHNQFSDPHLANMQIQTRFFNINQTRTMRGLNPDDIDKLICVNGLIIRTSNIIPEMQEAFFECCTCFFTTAVEIDCGGKILEPTVCSHCNSSHSMSIIHNRSSFSDKQLIKLQESPDDMPSGETPLTVLCYVHNDLIDICQPGDKVEITGIYRASPVRINPRQRSVRAIYRTLIDVLHIKKSTNLTTNTNSITNVERIIAMSKRADIYELLANNIAPNIYENDDVKKGILLQLFGGTEKTFDEKKVGRKGFRSEINILLCGDPGTSKSQLLKAVYDLTPRAQYTSGKGSSAVGLTVYVTKDPDTRQPVLQTGALVMSDNGICCIDEFDKMNDSTRSILHEVMEQQTLSIAKAGIICQLNARTSILAAANPVKSKWDPNLTTVDNIKLPHTLLSRFDLIFLMLDKNSEEYDQKLASHLVNLYNKEDEEEENLESSDESTFLKEYIAYAREHVRPELSSEAGDELVKSYVELRKAGAVTGSITAYPRQLESLIRLSEARAKVELRNVVSLSDVREAKRLHREALKQSCIDPKTGMIDLAILATGTTASHKKQIEEISKSLLVLFEKDNFVINKEKLYEMAQANSDVPINRNSFDEAVSNLIEHGNLMATGKNLRLV